VIILISLVAPVLGGELLPYHDTQTACLFIALRLGRRRVGVDTATDAYNSLAQQFPSDQKRWPGAGRFKATTLEEVIKSLVQDVTGDPEEPLLEVDSTSFWRT